MSSKSPQRIAESREEIVERDVVITRYNHSREGQGIKESHGASELRRPRPLRKVARHGNDVRLEVSHAVDQCVDNDWVVGSEVQIGQVSDRSHYGWRPSGCAPRTSTRNAADLSR